MSVVGQWAVGIQVAFCAWVELWQREERRAVARHQRAAANLVPVDEVLAAVYRVAPLRLTSLVADDSPLCVLVSVQLPCSAWVIARVVHHRVGDWRASNGAGFRPVGVQLVRWVLGYYKHVPGCATQPT